MVASRFRSSSLTTRPFPRYFRARCRLDRCGRRICDLLRCFLPGLLGLQGESEEERARGRAAAARSSRLSLTKSFSRLFSVKFCFSHFIWIYIVSLAGRRISPPFVFSEKSPDLGLNSRHSSSSFSLAPPFSPLSSTNKMMEDQQCVQPTFLRLPVTSLTSSLSLTGKM